MSRAVRVEKGRSTERARVKANAKASPKPVAVLARTDATVRDERSMEDAAPNGSGAELTTREAILRAAWNLLLTDGAAGISTRKVAREAGVNQALVHYHFGSLDHLMIEVLDHLTTIVVRRQKARYVAGRSFMDEYRADMKDLLSTDHRTTGWGKVWLEATAIAVNNPDTIGKSVSPQSPRARAVLMEQLLSAVSDSGGSLSEADAEGLVVLVYALRAMVVLDSLIGSTKGHERAVELLGDLLERSLSATAAPRRAKPTKLAKSSTAAAPAPKRSSGTGAKAGPVARARRA